MRGSGRRKKQGGNARCQTKKWSGWGWGELQADELHGWEELGARQGKALGRAEYGAPSELARKLDASWRGMPMDENQRNCADKYWQLKDLKGRRAAGIRIDAGKKETKNQRRKRERRERGAPRVENKI